MDNNERAICLLEGAILRIKKFKDIFVAYNTRFLGVSPTDDFIINGEKTEPSVATNEFCFGYDSNGGLHVLNVYKTKNGVKYAAQEIAWSLYGFWLILE